MTDQAQPLIKIIKPAVKFPPDIIRAAQVAQKNTGCPACVTLAQWALESFYGHALSGKFNYFGIKWHPKSSFPFRVHYTKEQLKNGQWIVIQAKFIDFPDLATAFSYHGKLLLQAPYNAAPYEHDWRVYLHHIASIYATDKAYEQKLLKIIADNKLDQYNLGK